MRTKAKLVKRARRRSQSEPPVRAYGVAVKLPTFTMTPQVMAAKTSSKARYLVLSRLRSIGFPLTFAMIRLRRLPERESWAQSRYKSELGVLWLAEGVPGALEAMQKRGMA